MSSSASSVPAVLSFSSVRHHDLGEAEPLADLLGGPAQRLEQHGDGLATLAVDTDADGVALVDVELQPRAAAGDHLDASAASSRWSCRCSRRSTRPGERTSWRHDDALGAVDDERALLGHHREVTHEHRLALDLAGVVVDELGRDEQRGRVGLVLVLALVDGRLDLVEARVGERQRHLTRRSPRSGTARRAPLRDPPTGFAVHRERCAFSRHSSEPISHWKDSVCTSSRPGTSSGSRNFAKEIRLGAPGTELLAVATADLLWRETAKMHPSSTSCDHKHRADRHLRRDICVGSHRLTTRPVLRHAGKPNEGSSVDHSVRFR